MADMGNFGKKNGKFEKFKAKFPIIRQNRLF